MDEKFRFSDLEKNFPPYIPRVQIQEYFPWLSSKRMANLDCQGNGPTFVKNGRAIIYPTRSLLKWLDQRNDERNEKLIVDEGEGSCYEEIAENISKCLNKKGRGGRKKKWVQVRERRGLNI